MFDKDKAIGYMRMQGCTIPQASKRLGIPLRTMYRKLSSGMFTAPELEDMVREFKVPSMDDLFREIGR